jgi:hypothetical protein
MKTSIQATERPATSHDGPFPRRDYGLCELKCGHLGEMDGHLQRANGKCYSWCYKCDCDRLIVKKSITGLEAYYIKKGLRENGEQEVLF